MPLKVWSEVYHLFPNLNGAAVAVNPYRKYKDYVYAGC